MVAGKRPRSPTPERSFVRRSTKTWAIECMSFDGVEQSIEACAPSQPVGGHEGLTISAWVKRSRCEGGDNDRLIDFGNGAEKENIVINFGRNNMNYETHHTATPGVDGMEGGCGATPYEKHTLAVTSNSEGSSLGSSSGSGSSTFPEDAWTHVAVVHRADGVASIFWNGSLKAKGKVLLPLPVERSKYYVGKSHWGTDPYFKGNISEVFVFNYPLTPSELQRCAHGRSMPGGNRAAPVLSIASAWREVLTPAPCLSALGASHLGGGATRASGLSTECDAAMKPVQREDLLFLPCLSESQQRQSLQQLEQAYVIHGEQVDHPLPRLPPLPYPPLTRSRPSPKPSTA